MDIIDENTKRKQRCFLNRLWTHPERKQKSLTLSLAVGIPLNLILSLVSKDLQVTMWRIQPTRINYKKQSWKAPAMGTKSIISSYPLSSIHTERDSNRQSDFTLNNLGMHVLLKRDRFRAGFSIGVNGS